MSAKWLPIETAPKDGTLFLAYGPSGFGLFNEPEGGYMPGMWTKAGLGWSGYGDESFEEMTHWMPLPDPPEPSR